MLTYKITLMVKEFPFLALIAEFLSIKLDDVDSISVRKADVSLLRQKPSEDIYSWSGGGHHDYTRMFALWLEGGEWRWQELTTSGQSATASGDHREWDCQIIGKQLLEMGLRPDIILSCAKQDTDDNGRGEVRHDWVIHKMSRFDLSGFHKTEVAKAVEELTAEIGAACK